MDIYTLDTGLFIFQTSALIHIVLVGYCIYRLFKSDNIDSGFQRLYSFLLLIFIPILGSVIYLNQERRIRRRRKFSLDRKD